MMYSQKTVLL